MITNQSLTKEEVELMKKNATILGMVNPFSNQELIETCYKLNINLVSMEFIPRITRAQKMDVLSSQANIAGYKAVLIGSNHIGKYMPLLMTAAGTISPSRTLVIGAGVAGLQAIATAKRLGAVVEASDVRPAVKEQIESLGGKFIDVPFETEEEKEAAEGQGGYAKAMPQSWLKRQSELVAQKAMAADIIITSALIPGREPPVLISEEVVKKIFLIRS